MEYILGNYVVSAYLLALVSICAGCNSATDKTHNSNDLAARKEAGDHCVDISHKEFYQFIDSADKWTKESFEKGFSLRRCTDGGPLEDLDIALGIFMEKDPELFFEKVLSEKESDYVIGHLVSVLPLELSEDIPGAIERIRFRQSIIQKIQLPCCMREREVALRALAEQLGYLQKLVQKGDGGIK